MERLTNTELQLLINIVSQVSVPVIQAPQYISLVNKMSKMLDEIRHEQMRTEEPSE